MKQLFLFTIIALFTITNGQSQELSTFEAFNLAPGNFLNNGGEDNGFYNGALFFPNQYNSMYDSWSGWAISAAKDTLTPGFSNQYSAITGSGNEGSNTYAVSYAPFGSIIQPRNPGTPQVFNGIYITNSTYAYWSMKDGDSFAKKFGGEAGEDPDFFLVTIKKFRNGEKSLDSINVYLADYRDNDPAKDYIVKDWIYVDLSTLGEADSLHFSLSSSDNGIFGMNTPAYFCIDDVGINAITSTKSGKAAYADIRLYPNPAQEYIVIHWEGLQETLAAIFDASGRKAIEQSIILGENRIAINRLNPGIYTCVIRNSESLIHQKFLKIE